MADIDAIFGGGGAPRVALLRYCVLSVTMEPLFVFLTDEYRRRPTHTAALALYDVFCAPDAIARISAAEQLPPRNLRLRAVIESIRSQWDVMQSPAEVDEDGPAPRTTVPHRDLFDGVATALRGDAGGPLAALAARYDPGLEPEENLAAGRMSARQRHFVDKVWRPLARPRLVAAGFWQLSSIE